MLLGWYWYYKVRKNLLTFWLVQMIRDNKDNNILHVLLIKDTRIKDDLA